MAISYTWAVNSITKENEGWTLNTDETDSVRTALTDFVQSINVTITGTEGSITSTYNINAHLFHVPETIYTDYSSITTEKLIEWAKTSLGQNTIDSIEAQLALEISAQQSTSNVVEWESSTP